MIGGRIMNEKYLVESCLLTHDLRSVTDEEMMQTWQGVNATFAWIDKGKIQTGSVEQFIEFRKRKIKLRVNYKNIDEMLEKKVPGALTASGTMEACRRLEIPTAVTCGIGGIGNVPGEKICTDLPALAEIPVNLVATSPKDMINIPQTFTWLRERGVKIFGYHTDYCTGYVFYSAHEKLDGTFDTVPMERTGKTLLLNPIPMEDRIQDNQILEQAVKEAFEAVKRGEYFHPAANGAIDKLTDGKASYIQLASIVENAKLAENIAKTR